MIDIEIFAVYDYWFLKKGVRWATGSAVRQPTLTTIAKVTVRTGTIDLNVLLGSGVGMGMGIDVDGSESLLTFSMEPLLSDLIVAWTSTPSSSSLKEVISTFSPLFHSGFHWQTWHIVFHPSHFQRPSMFNWRIFKYGQLTLRHPKRRNTDEEHSSSSPEDICKQF